MNDIEIEHARNVDIRDILGLKRTTRRLSIKCVFHNDNTPSLCIYPGTGGYNCFGCGKNGRNAIDFLIDLGYNFKQAVKELQDYV